jgi:hypothetical protein
MYENDETVSPIDLIGDTGRKIKIHWYTVMAYYGRLL